MTNNSSFQPNGAMDEQNADFNYREILDALILHWYWFLLSVLLCGAGAYVYLRYQSPVYTSWMKVLIKEEDAFKRARNGSMVDFSELGVVTNSYGFDNELEILKSKLLAKRAVTNLKLHVRYAFKGRIRNRELYGDSPLTAEMDMVDMDSIPGTLKLEITPAGKEYHVTGEVLESKFETQVKTLPAKVKTPCGWVSLMPNANFDMQDRTLIVSITRPDFVAKAYAAGLAVEPTSKSTTIARISINDTERRRAEDYLNELIRVYNEDANEVKNEVAMKTEVFINNRIQIIDTELGSTESELESFKKRNKLVNLSSDADIAYSGAESYQNKQTELQTQMMLVKSLKDYVDNPTNYLEIIPANLGLNDASLNRIITEYNEKVMERNRLLKTAPETSPAVVSATNAISTLYPGIRHSLATVYENLRVQKRSVDDQYNSYMSRLSQAPTQERILTDIGRQQSVKAALYQILLQKREENAISLASTVDKAQVVDVPESSDAPVSPKRNMIYLIALVVGVAIPTAILYLINLLRYRIEGRNDIEKLTNIPVLSDIFVAKHEAGKKRAIVVKENSNEMMEETFRNLRTNLGFVMKRDEKVLICTSVIPSEGKTFISTNLAMSMALMGRKVLVVGLDLRKPRLAKLFGLQSKENGLATYLVSDESDAFLRGQIFKSGIHPDLDVLPAGLIPPNPGELITSSRLDHAFKRFREWYDFVIIDTPPIGLVSDTLLLGRLADATLVVCRCNFSLKRNFAFINSLRDENKLPRVNLVLNGVDLESRKYGYYYGSGKYSHYGYYGSYGRYGTYGTVKGKDEKGKFIREDHWDDGD